MDNINEVNSDVGALIELLNMSIDDVKEGRVFSSTDFKTLMAERRKAAEEAEKEKSK